MKTPKHYRQRIAQAIGGSLKKRWGKWRIEGEIALEADTPEEAKYVLSRIRLIKKELRLIRKEIHADIQEIRAHYNERIHKTKPGIVSRALIGKGKSKSIAARQKRQLRAQRNAAIAPYEDLKRGIDGLLLQLDHAQAELQRIIRRDK